MNILVTGTSGFLVTYITSILQQKDHIVRCISVRDTAIFADALADIDCVIHIAGVVPGKEQSEPDFYTVNYETTKALLDASVAMQVKKFVYVSSMAVYGDILCDHRHQPVTCQTMPSPQSPYGKSKYLAEQYICAENAIDWTIIRCPSLYDSQDTHYLDMYRRITAWPLPLPWFRHNTGRSLLHKESLCVLLAEAAQTDLYSKRIVLPADAKQVDSNDLIHFLAPDRRTYKIIGYIYSLLSRMHPFFCCIAGCACYAHQDATFISGHCITNCGGE